MSASRLNLITRPGALSVGVKVISLLFLLLLLRPARAQADKLTAENNTAASENPPAATIPVVAKVSDRAAGQASPGKPISIASARASLEESGVEAQGGGASEIIALSEGKNDMVRQGAPISLERVDRAETNKFFQPGSLPVEPSSDHLANSKIDFGPLRQYNAGPLSSSRPIRLEASYNEPLTLEDALRQTLANNLPVRISGENFKYQKYQFFRSLSGFLPSFSTGWGYVYVSVEPITTSANSRVFVSQLSLPVFRGGGVVYPMLAQFYRYRSYEHVLKSSINDALLNSYLQYTNLLQNYAILQIRGKSCEISRKQLELNNALFRAGTGTRFAIMQSRAQLANDEQQLLLQQALTRQSSLALSYALNLPMAINFVPVSESISETELLSHKLPVNHLLNAAMSFRPELKQYELSRLAACRAMQSSAAAFYPSVSFQLAFSHASTTVYPADNADQMNGAASTGFANFSVGPASNTALGQTASFSPTGNNQGTGGATTTPTYVAASGGNPLANTQSGGLVTSAATAPGFATYNGNVFNSSGVGVFPGLTNTFRMGFSLNWNVSSLDQQVVGNILADRNRARQSLLNSNQEMVQVVKQVRSAYCNKAAAREQIDAAAYQVGSAGEALRIAEIRLRAGSGSNLELIQAQRDYITALIAQVQAIVASNQAQAQLLHDSGLISYESLTKGYKDGSGGSK